MFRKLVVFVIAASVAVAAASSVRADAPTITTSTRTIAPSLAPEISAACGFTVLHTFTLETRRISFTDDAGNEVRRIGHSSFEGYLIKASTGEALPWHAVWTQILDVAAGTITIDGLRQDVEEAAGQPAMMAGHAVYAAAAFPSSLLEASTRGEFADWWGTVCTAFSS